MEAGPGFHHFQNLPLPICGLKPPNTVESYHGGETKNHVIPDAGLECSNGNIIGLCIYAA
ncbi:hypothetical protein ABFW99_001460 [Gracilimonas sp. BCB1]